MEQNMPKNEETVQTADQEQMQKLLSLLASNLSDNQAYTAGSSKQAKTVKKDEGTIDLIELFWHVISKFHIILAVALVGAIIGMIYATFIHVPMYQATSKLYILNSSESVIDLSDLQIGNALGPDYTEVFKTWEVCQMVLDDLNLDYSYGQLRGMLSVSIPANSRVLYLTVTSADPKEAMTIANSFAKAGKTFITQTMNTEEPNTFSLALEPSSPSTQGGVFYVFIATILGALLAMAVIVAVHLLDDRPRSAEDVADSCGIPVLSVIPLDSKKNMKQLK